MATKTVQRSSDLAIPPGELLEEDLEARGITQKDLARQTGRPAQAINEIIRGRRESRLKPLWTSDGHSAPLPALAQPGVELSACPSETTQAMMPHGGSPAGIISPPEPAGSRS